MLTLTRDTKRLTIIAIYLLTILVIGVGIYLVFKPKPTCFDGKQNQSEQGVDCGGICAVACVEKIVGNDILVREIAFIPADRGRYDVVAKIFNPNNDIGAASFQYSLLLRDASGKEIGRVTNSSFILPQETKTLLAFNFEPVEVPAKAVIEMSDFRWTRLRGYQAKPELNIYSKRYVEQPSQSAFGAALGTLVNESVYDFRRIQVKVVLRDENNTPLAVNQTEMQTVNVGREQEITLIFPQPFEGKVSQVEVEAEANIYDQDNFLQHYQIPKETSGPGSGFETPAL